MHYSVPIMWENNVIRLLGQRAIITMKADFSIAIIVHFQDHLINFILRDSNFFPQTHQDVTKIVHADKSPALLVQDTEKVFVIYFIFFGFDYTGNVWYEVLQLKETGICNINSFTNISTSI